MKSKIWTALVAFSFLFLAACGGGDDSYYIYGSTGQVNVGITDAATTDYQAVYVTVRQVAVQKDGENGWDVISTPHKTFNLLELVNGVIEDLAGADLATGHYNQIRLILADTPDDTLNIRSVEHPYANYFINDSGQSVELKVPSGFQTGIKIVSGFDIVSGQTTELLLDFDAARSIVKAGSSGQWLLKPTIQMLAIRECSIIRGNAGAEGILVSAQAYDGSAAPAARVQVAAATVSDVDGNYKLFLQPGTYTLVGYKDGYATYYKDTKIITAAGSTHTADFFLGAEAPSGTLTGGVEISGADAEQSAAFSIRQSVTIDGNSEEIEVKSFNVANGGTFSTGLPVEDYGAVISTEGKTTMENLFSIVADETTDIGTIAF